MLRMEDIKGVIPPIITPVDENENVDEDRLKRVIDHVIDGESTEFCNEVMGILRL